MEQIPSEEQGLGTRSFSFLRATDTITAAPAPGLHGPLAMPPSVTWYLAKPC